VTRPKRFDTRFFVRLAPPHQVAMPDYGEALELMWLTPAEALDPQRGLKLLNVTQRVLRDMHHFASARAAFDHALALRGVSRIFPRPALGPDGPRFVIEGDPAYEEVAHLDPQGRGQVRCELKPGDVLQLSSRLWRIGGAAGNAYLVTDTLRTEAALIDADPSDAEQWRSLCKLAEAPVRWLLFSQTEDVQVTALQAHWPAAQVPSPALAIQPLKIGADSTLQRLPTGQRTQVFVLKEDGWALGELAQADSSGRTIGTDWLAPRLGFTRRIATGSHRSS
jgi:hypothetical protein